MIGVVVLLALTVQCVVGAATPSGWKVLNGHSYGFIGDQKTWNDAQKSCRSYGAELVEINNAEEDQFVVATLKALKQGNSWIGGAASLPGKKFEWVTSHRTVDCQRYVNWNAAEPNNAGGSEWCLEIRDIGWNDHDCNTRNSFVCEK
uniref:C-type lectin domain-containing protein n=1 Tax=Arion vulgaris TaxID=1028688 RepID=A0A0B7AGC8_9EUPU